MPKMTEDEIRAAIAAGRLRMISLDTSIFDRYQRNLENKLLLLMSQFRGTDVGFVLAEIVFHELKRHLILDLEATEQKLRSALRDVGKTWRLPPGRRDEAQATLLEGKSAATKAEEMLQTYRLATNYRVIDSAQRVDIRTLQDRYFNQKPPFEARDAKKHEFPDAIALMTLDAYATEVAKLMLVVSQDSGWTAYADRSENLVCEKDLATALSYFQNAPTMSERLTERLSAGETPRLADAIKQCLQSFVPDMDIHIEASSRYFYDADIPEIELISVGTEGVEMVLVDHDANESTYVIEMKVTGSLEISCSFSFSLEDGEDSIDMGGAYFTKTRELEFVLTITLSGDPYTEFDVADAEVVRHDTTVYFGDIEPDFGDTEE